MLPGLFTFHSQPPVGEIKSSLGPKWIFAALLCVPPGIIAQTVTPSGTEGDLSRR